jgi:hypothetical protein
MSEENQNEFNFGGHVTHIEDSENAQTPREGIKTLTDEELETAGLIRTSAFVRSKRSKNALRVEKHKKQKEDKGIKQLNVEVADEHREILKQLANALKEGQNLAVALKTILSNTKISDSPKKPQNAIESDSKAEQINYANMGMKVAGIKAQGGFKAFLLNRLI